MKIKEEELNKIKNQQKDLENIIKNVGMLETQKHALLHQLADHNKEIEGTKNELENSYGAININLEDGSYTELSKEDVTEMKVVENVE
jgi:septal ring factor EnvC (AmiA/AmiB activator)